MAELEDQSPATVRFAATPTGHIHIGNARIALFNWLYARQRQGEFILRFDDTEVDRSKTEYADAILADLRWLGMTPDTIAWQSKRFDGYAAAADRLKAAELLYACYETADELERKRKLRVARRMPPIYDREALKLTDNERLAFEAEGRRRHWRFLLPNFSDSPFETRRTEVHWEDVIRGPQTVDLASMSDPVLIRDDGSYRYTLPSVVDDIEMAVSHIIHGDDHVADAGAQIALFHALGSDAPAFGHLLTSASGEGLSKRPNALSIGSLREAGYEPMAVNSLAVRIGTTQRTMAMPSMDVLLEHFKADSASKPAARFDPAELTILNRSVVHELNYDVVSDRLAELGINGERAEAFWLAVREHIDFVKDASRWWAIVEDGPENNESLDGEDLEFVRIAFSMLPPEPWDCETWASWTGTVKAATGRGGNRMFVPLYVAFTGLGSGPELADLLPLIGRAKTLDRLP